MNEAETRAEHFDTALPASGWGVVEGSGAPDYTGAAGWVWEVRQGLTADYVLINLNRKLAVVDNGGVECHR